MNKFSTPDPVEVKIPNKSLDLRSLHFSFDQKTNALHSFFGQMKKSLPKIEKAFTLVTPAGFKPATLRAEI